MVTFIGEVKCDLPSESLEMWDGNVYADSLPKVFNCNIKSTLLRGCTLKNIEYAYGIVIYVGNNSKIMKNAKKPPRKISNLMKKMNVMFYTVFAF